MTRHLKEKDDGYSLFVPLDGPFAAVATRQDMDFWLPDGVHPPPQARADGTSVVKSDRGYLKCSLTSKESNV